MPWSKDDYPDSMKNMDPEVREKAIEIANTLVEEEGYAEGRAIAIAQSQAEEAVSEGSKPSGRSRQQGSSSQKGAPQHVRPREGEWVIEREGAKQATERFDTKEQARKRATEIASNQDTDLVLHDSEGNVQERWEAL